MRGWGNVSYPVVQQTRGKNNIFLPIIVDIISIIKNKNKISSITIKTL